VRTSLLTASGPRVEFYPEAVITKLLVCLLFAAAVAAANPYFRTFLNEVSVDSAHQFVELQRGPWPGDDDLTGWRIVTSRSVCTLTCRLDYFYPVVLDSEALAWGEVGRGSIRLEPTGDSIFVLNDTGVVEDYVCYPSSPTGHYGAPLPPSTGSVSFWNYDEGLDQSMNWYVDSTPTPGWANDDYSMIGGTVSGIGGIALDEVEVVASGQDGRCHCALYEETGYCVRGLGAGKYEVKASAYHRGHFYQATYPESISVGYSGTVSGIDFVFPASGVAETPSVSLRPLVRVSGRALLLTGDGTAPVDVQLYSQVGFRVSEYRLGPFTGEKRIELPATLAPGIYFAMAQKGTGRTTSKVVLW
jgi:hypothetical protein